MIRSTTPGADESLTTIRSTSTRKDEPPEQPLRRLLTRGLDQMTSQNQGILTDLTERRDMKKQTQLPGPRVELEIVEEPERFKLLKDVVLVIVWLAVFTAVGMVILRAVGLA